MKIRYMSDLHLEFETPGIVPFTIPEMEGDKDTVLILAGDIGLIRQPERLAIFFGTLKRFKAVFIIGGNHEAYGAALDAVYLILTDLSAPYDNIYVMEDEVVFIDDVAFIGSTLWADFNGADLSCMRDCGIGMNDYYKIKYRGRRLQTEDTLKLHEESVKYIFNAISFARREDKKVVVFTHMGPSTLSINKKYAGQAMNGAYTSNLDDKILTTPPDIWIHGHMDATVEYTLGDTRIMTNPRGYVGYIVNHAFDIMKIINV